MGIEEARQAQLRQIASGVIRTEDKCWTAGDPPTVWDRVREMTGRPTSLPAPIID